MTVTKRGKRWRAHVWCQGVRKGASFDTKAEAIAWKVDTERAIKAGRGVEVAGRTFGDALRKFAEEECGHRRQGEWEATRLAFLASDPIADVQLARLSPEVVLEWQRRQLGRVSGATVRRDRALISAVMTQTVRIWRWLPESPFKVVRQPPDNPHRERIATDEEIERLRLVAGEDYSTITARVVAAFELAVETGMRGGEILALRADDIDGAVARVRPNEFNADRASKNADARDVALSARAREILKAIGALELTPLFGITARQKDALFRKVLAKAGISGLRFHDARATACTRLARKLDVLELARQLGHRDLASLMIYYRDTAEQRAARLG